jgi:hypothetical protein
MHMETRWIVVAIIVILALAAVAWLVLRRKRSERLKAQFGPEYETAVHKYGSVTSAESELEARRNRVRRLEIVPLRRDQAERFAAAWRATQARFVDDPPRAIAEGDSLVQEVMRARGYPVSDFEQRVADISVDHPRVVENYRAAHAIALQTGGGRTDTEQARRAMVHYRALFEDLLDVRDDVPPENDMPRSMEGGRR